MAFRVEQILGWRSLVTVFYCDMKRLALFLPSLLALALSRVKYLDIPVVFTAMQNIGEVIHKKITIFI